MKAIVINGYGGPEMLEVAELPTPVPGAGEVLMRVRAAAVNPADHKWRSGMFAGVMPVTFPHVLGYDVAGEAVEGEGFPRGTRLFGMVDPVRKGGYAGYAVASAASLAPMPDNMDFATAAAIPTAGLTGLQLVERGVDVQPGQTILLTGAVGAVGRFALHAAKARGAQVVAAVRPAQRDAAIALGADAAIILGEDGDGWSFDHVLDTVGGEDVARLCRRLRQGGSIATVATDPVPAEGLPAAPQFFAVTPDGADCGRLAAIVASGAIPLPIAHILPLDQAAEAQRLVEAGGLGGKVILTP